MSIVRGTAMIFAVLGWSAAALAQSAPSRPAEVPPKALAAALSPIILAVDKDDDDANGVPDRDQRVVPPDLELFSLRAILGSARGGAANAAIEVPSMVRLLRDGEPVAATVQGAGLRGARRLEAQAVRPGRGILEIFGQKMLLSGIEVRALDGSGNEVDFTRSHATLERTPPVRLGDDPFAATSNPDSLRFVVIGVAADLPGTLTIHSVDSAEHALDVLSDVALTEIRCPKDVAEGLTCGSTVPIRAASDDIDKNHPTVALRSILAELGGALIVTSGGGKKLQTIRVGGPRQSPIGPIAQYEARLRVFVVRSNAGGAAPLGRQAASARDLVRAEVRAANSLWGSCGIRFGDPSNLVVSVVDPPRAHLLALGCDRAIPASGGTIALRVDGRPITAKLRKGMRPAEAARVVAAAMNQAGVVATVSDNARIGAGAFPTSDVLVRHRNGSLATITPPVSGEIVTDKTMTACIGEVDLEDGLQHFGDIDAIAGTVEERTLLKAFDDGDPSTIEIVVVAAFAGGGRIGESFIGADGGSIRNAVLIDRAGIRADRASFALAHEIGHVLLDDPGHPDDFGVDTPTRLMDADSANSSAFGPRRLLVTECARAILQSGPGSNSGILKPRPFTALGAR